MIAVLKKIPPGTSDNNFVLPSELLLFDPHTTTSHFPLIRHKMVIQKMTSKKLKFKELSIVGISKQINLTNVLLF